MQQDKETPEQNLARRAKRRAYRERLMADPYTAKKLKERATKDHKAYRLVNKGKIRRRNLSKLGWTPEGYDITFATQGGVCDICGKPETVSRRNPNGVLYADHEHTVPPIPRGLLCCEHNTAIGLLGDDPVLCEAAAVYLRKWGK